MGESGGQTLQKACASTSAMAQMKQFSADIVDRDKNGETSKTKVYEGAAKVRTDQMSDTGIVTVDFSSNKLYMLMPKGKAYMEIKLNDPAKVEFSKSISLLAPQIPAIPVRREEAGD